jgi:hypothetical protein
VSSNWEPPAGAWECEAYGPGGMSAGAWCFIADAGGRECASAAHCAVVMRSERQRLFGLIQAMAAAGDETGRELAAVFTHPDQLLGGPDAPAGEP